MLIGATKQQTAAATVAQRVCTRQVSVCKKGKRPLWPEGKPRKNEEFKPRDPKDDELDDLWADVDFDGGGAAGAGAARGRATALLQHIATPSPRGAAPLHRVDL